LHNFRYYKLGPRNICETVVQSPLATEEGN